MGLCWRLRHWDDVELLSLHNELLPSSAAENSTLPFARSEPPPPNARNAAKSFASQSRVVVGRARDGDVGRYNMRPTASSSLTQGLYNILSVYTRGGVAVPTVGTEKDDSADGNSEEVLTGEWVVTHSGFEAWSSV